MTILHFLELSHAIKIDVSKIFLQFKTMVENTFQTSIKKFQSDGGGGV